MNDIYRYYYKGDVNMIGVWEEEEEPSVSSP